jgi:hypothetical protein
VELQRWSEVRTLLDRSGKNRNGKGTGEANVKVCITLLLLVSVVVVVVVVYHKKAATEGRAPYSEEQSFGL